MNRPVVALLGLLALGGSPSNQLTDELAKLPRQERVRRLQQRSWTMKAAPVEAELVIDGRCDDPAWSLAVPITDFYQGETNEGLPATERTEVRVLYDETSLYVGFRCYDREPSKINARGYFRDETPSSDDAVAVMIDAFNNHRSAIQFATNANGLKLDLLQNGETRETRNRNWDTVWDAKGSRSSEGWEAEVVIPFKSLRFDPPAPGEAIEFGIGFKRNIPRKNEEVTWPFVSNDSTWYRPAELGHLRGLQDIKPGRSIELRPYVLGRLEQFRESDSTEKRGELGGDVKWGVTSGMTADFTYNTDFAQEEADVQQINFTRFSLFFPEKRQFFLEGERMFQFGIPKEADLVFTRRIGLSASGEVVPILAGARLSGQQGRTSIGAMNIQTQESLSLPAENFTVLRLRRDFLSRSSFGALFTNRAGGETYNRVLGGDINLLFRQVWFLEGFLARVDESGNAPGTHGAYGRMAYDADRFGASYRYLDFEENFRPGVGFVRRPNSREHFTELRYSPRPGTERVRQLHFRVPVRYVTNQRNVLETRERGAEFTTTLESGDEISFTYLNSLESIEVPFDLGEVTISPGTYHFSTYGARVNTFQRRPITFNAGFLTGGFWDGSRDRLSLEASYRVNKNFGVSGNYEVNWLDLVGGSFTTHLLSSRVQIAFRKEVVLMSLIQYNSTRDQLSANVRFNWIPKPGSDFFIVYNELDHWARVFQVRNRSLTVKLNYLFAL